MQLAQYRFGRNVLLFVDMNTWLLQPQCWLANKWIAELYFCKAQCASIRAQHLTAYQTRVFILWSFGLTPWGLISGGIISEDHTSDQKYETLLPTTQTAQCHPTRTQCESSPAWNLKTHITAFRQKSDYSTAREANSFAFGKPTHIHTRPDTENNYHHQKILVAYFSPMSNFKTGTWNWTGSLPST
jgi:hypothetical protein